MARAVERLKWNQVPKLTPGLHADGNGLYCRVDETGNRRWVFIYYRLGKRREMGLGNALAVKLADARKAAALAKDCVSNGGDPIAERRAAAVPPEDHSFSAVAGRLMDDLEPGWKSPKQRPQWEASLKTHAAGIWKMDVAAVDTEAVIAALRPIWLKSPETASRVRSRVERVLDAAKARGLREGENPARWRGHLSILLPKQPKDRGHHAAMPYQDVPAFLRRLEGRSGMAAMALRFLILTAARSGEVLGAQWPEIDGETWVVPAERMKAGRVHRVPLSAEALAILAAARPAGSTYLFPGLNGPLSRMALEMQMRKMKVEDATPHGFRSAFRDWVGDCTVYPREIAEAALAHTIGNAAEQAYRRGDALEKRRQMMAAWADHCAGRSGQVVSFNRA